MSGLLGVNFNCLKRPIPEGYVLKPGCGNAVHDDLAAIKIHTPINRLRTIVWVTERDPVDTPWLHIPLFPEEIDRIVDYCTNSPIPVRLALGPLWEAKWLWEEGGIDVRNNPFSTSDALVDAYRQSMMALGSRLPEGTEWDLYNEMMMVPGQMEIARKWIPWASSFCREQGWPHTVSTIIDAGRKANTLSSVRAFETYAAVIDTLRVRLDFLEIHINGLNKEAIAIYLPGIIKSFQKRYWLPVSVGECDVDLDGPALSALYGAGIRDLLLWR